MVYVEYKFNIFKIYTVFDLKVDR